MDTKVALLVFVLAATADEVSSRGLKETGGMIGPQKPQVRIAIKAGMLPIYLATQKKSKAVRFGVPALFIVAAALNVRQSRK